MINLGDTAVNKVVAGSANVIKIMAGDKKVWPPNFYQEDFSHTVGTEWTLGSFNQTTGDPGYIKASQSASATLILPTMSTSGTFFAEVYCEFDGYKKIKLNGTTEWTASQTGAITTATFSLPSGDNTIVFENNDPPPPPQAEPPIFTIYKVWVELD